MDRDVADHLLHTYGTSSVRVVALGEEQAKSKYTATNARVHPEYPFLKSELLYAIKYEMAEKPNDVICRRVPIAFLDKKAAEALLPEVVELLRREKGWSSS